jgi:hypothetical protein
MHVHVNLVVGIIWGNEGLATLVSVGFDLSRQRMDGWLMDAGDSKARTSAYVDHTFGGPWTEE